MFGFKKLLKINNPVNFTLTEKELKQLIELVFVGEWVLTHDKDTHNPYDAVRNKLYAHAYERGFTKQITHSLESGGYFETKSFEQSLLKKINRFVRAEQA